MKLRKLPYNATHYLLTTGASLILGFLSFGGMLALSPVLPAILPLAVAAFGLSVAYEGEIYFQNIKGALDKLFGHSHMKRRMAKSFLLELFIEKNFDITSAECPQFFKDYHNQCLQRIKFEHKTLDSVSLKHKEQIETTLHDMENVFALHLFSQGENNTLFSEDIQQNLQEWLKANDQARWITEYQNLSTKFNFIKVFSMLSALFMGMSTTYLLTEAFSVIPLLSSLSLTALPWIVVPLAAIAGLAYGLLTYNAVTDMLTNNRVQAMYKKIFKADNEWTLHRIFMAGMAILLGILAMTLTVCTAGTWWTVAKEATPIFSWMRKMPEFLMGVFNPVITGLSALVFNLQNTAESLEIIQAFRFSEDNVLKRINNIFNAVRESEHWLQWINPFRLVLKITITPLRVFLFLGHLISIGVTADRVPGISKILSAIIGIISEGFEDLHYFVGHGDAHCCGHHHHSGNDRDGFNTFLRSRLSAEQGHNHDLDLPTKVLKGFFYPIYWLAAYWDSTASRFNSNPLSFDDAWDKQTGQHKAGGEETVTLNHEHSVSQEWTVTQALYRIDRHKQKQLEGAWVSSSVAQGKVAALSRLQQKLLQPEHRGSVPSIQQCIHSELTDPVYNQHRWFGEGDTATTQLLKELPERLLFV